MNRRYLVAVALLAVLVVVFGLVGTVAPPLAEEVKPSESSSSSSSSVAHFTNPPSYDSGWVNITDKAGQYFTLKHGLNTTEVFVGITGKQGLDPEGGSVAWSKTFGEAGGSLFVNYGQSIVQTSDGGFAVAGYEGEGIDMNCSLYKIDADGNMLWNKKYGGLSNDRAYSVVQTTDGGYAIAGSGFANLVKTDSGGNMLWNKKYGGGGNSVVQTSDGGYAIAGNTWRNSTNQWDFYLVKTDSSGNMIWEKTYGGADYDSANSIIQTDDGGYALAGQTNSFGAGYDFWLVKTDADGNKLWDKTYRDPAGGNVAYSVIQTDDGGYALTGEMSYVGDFVLVKTDSSGNMQWYKTYGGTSGESAYSVVQTGDGGYALAGHGAGGYVFWLVKTDSTGTAQWNKTYGETNINSARSLVQTGDGGYALTGTTLSFAGAYSGILVVKTNVEKNLEHQRNFGNVEIGLTWTGLTENSIILCRAKTDSYWNYVRVRIWLIKEPTWIYGDINMDGIVDVKDLYILSRNYGKAFSLLSLSGIAFIAGIQTYKTRKNPKATDK